MTTARNLPLLLLLCLTCPVVFSDPLHDQMYQYHPYSLTRTFFNHTGPIGGHTTKGGIVAPLYLAQNTQDLTTLKQLQEKQIIVTSSNFLSNTFAQALKEYSPSGWIIVHATRAPYLPFSPAKPTIWNPNASGLRWEQLDFPIVFVANTTSSDELIAKAEWNQHNNAHDRYNAQVGRLDPYVGPNTMNVTQCYALNRCKPMGGYSIWSTLGAADNRTKVFAVTQLDAISMDMGHAVGANAGASGMIALMAAAAMFNRSMEAIQYKRQISFGFFDGESFNRMGSTRFVRDLAQWSCKDSVMGPHGYNVCKGTYGKKWSTAAAPSWYWVPDTFSTMNNTEYVLAIDHVGRKAMGNQGMYVHGVADDGGQGSLAASLAGADYGTKGMGLTVGTPPSSSESEGNGGASGGASGDASGGASGGASAVLPPSAADAFIAGTHGMKNVPEQVNVLKGGAANVAVMTGFNTHVEEVNPLYVEWSYIRLPLAKSICLMF